MKPQRLAVAALALLGLASFAPSARAQLLTPERVQYALDMTDRRIEQAQTVLTGVDNALAQGELNLAVTIQTQARSIFASPSTGYLERAMRLTLEARGHADRAIAVVRGLPDPDRVRVQLERTRDVIEGARQTIEECNNDRARSMLHTGIEMQSRAEAAAGDGRFLAALQLTMSARERVLKALQLCNADESQQDRAEQAFRRTADVIARAQEIVSQHPDDRAREALSRAGQIEDRATDEFRLQHFEASIRLSLVARAAAYRAIRLADGGL
jgi:hypothetical protein